MSGQSNGYNPQKIEPKWREVWHREDLGQSIERNPQRNKKYVLDMFPYPSGAGLHVGHIEGYAGTDVLSRYYRMKGEDVLHPMGWDAFGLPAENYAIKIGVHPHQSTQENIENFREQMDRAGLLFDWSRELSTADPDFYRWTQWLFLKLFEQGLAYQDFSWVNWCPSCQTVLANEQVITHDEKSICERCENEVIQRELKQWFFKITEYVDELLQDLGSLEWPESTKQAQRNWIGRSEGVEIDFPVKSGSTGKMGSVRVFTTRPDTINSATFLVLAPEHDLLKELELPEDQTQLVQEYIESSLKKTVRQRQINKDKTGVFSGLYAVNPYDSSEIPIWISDFVLVNYGTGAIMAVPGYDERDRQFAEEFGLPVIEKDFLPQEEIVDQIERSKWGERTVNYRLRDWLISRQRYWGAPIPIIYCEHCGSAEQPAIRTVPVEDLPVLLPEDVDFKPTGVSPLLDSASFHQVTCPKCGRSDEGVRRESDTMDTFVDSSWYFLRFCDPHNSDELAGKQSLEDWMPVDVYVGGAGGEHAVLHLLYARFIVKALRDAGEIKFDEPFLRLIHPGTVLGTDNREMGKRYGNVINPNDVIDQVGADTLRMYELFMGPFDGVKSWNVGGLKGIYRLLERVWRFNEEIQGKEIVQTTTKVNRKLHQLILKVEEDILQFKFNTAISVMMEFINLLDEEDALIKEEDWLKFIQVLSPFAPFITEEIWQNSGRAESGSFVSIHTLNWPEANEELALEEYVSIPVQVNGKLRAVLEVPRGSLAEEDVTEQAKAMENVAARLESGIQKIIYKKDQLINFVVHAEDENQGGLPKT